MATQDERISKPVPDPTELTTEAVDRLKGVLVDLFTQRFEYLEKFLKQEIEHSTILTGEKFKGVEQQFGGRDIALTAALQAAEKSATAQYAGILATNAKTEGAVTKEIDSIKALINATNNMIDGKIGDVKDRLTVIESHDKGVSDSWGWLVGVVGLFVTIVTVFFFLANKIGN